VIERYATPAMAVIWSERTRLERWLEVEILAMEGWAVVGAVPEDAAREARAKKPIIDERFVRRWKEIERRVGHDLAAFVDAVAESIGGPGRYLHYGLTSSDIVDTALATALRDSCDVLIDGAEGLARGVGRLAAEHRDTLTAGRTHGVHAQPTSFGLKMASWYSEMQRNLGRLRAVRETVSVGKLSGAVGTYATVDPRVEAYVCDRLGLQVEPVSTQVVPRDRHAEYVAVLAIVASSIERFATEVRSLQRTEVGEVREPFGREQKGSSAMPHKKNPVLSERVCGLARVVRGYVSAALENVVLWHERDISNSSVERVVLPDASSLVDFMLSSFGRVVDGLRVDAGRMRENLDATGGALGSQRLMVALLSAGVPREDAYRLVQSVAARAEEGRRFDEVALEDPVVRRHLDEDDVRRAIDYSAHLRHVPMIFDRLGLGTDAERGEDRE